MSETYSTGWVYVLSHDKYDYVKIGYTLRTVEERIKELHSGTGALIGYKCEYAILVSNPRDLEKRVHQLFRNARVWPNKEFFQIGSAVSNIKCNG